MEAGRVAVASVVDKGSNSEAGGGKGSGDSSGGDGCGGKGGVGGVGSAATHYAEQTHQRPTERPDPLSARATLTHIYHAMMTTLLAATTTQKAKWGRPPLAHPRGSSQLVARGAAVIARRSDSRSSRRDSPPELLELAQAGSAPAVGRRDHPPGARRCAATAHPLRQALACAAGSGSA